MGNREGRESGPRVHFCKPNEEGSDEKRSRVSNRTSRDKQWTPLVSSNRTVEWFYRVFLGRDRLNRKEAVWGYIFCIPWIVGFLMLTVGPFLVSAYMSFFDWSGFGTPKFIGFHNYEWMVTGDTMFPRSLGATFYFAALAVPSTLVVGFVVASLLTKDRPGVRVYRAIFYMPTVVTGASAAFIWLFVLNSRGPLAKGAQALFHLAKPVAWLATPELVVPAFSMMRVWVMGTAMIVLLGALKGVPRQYYESATIAGANGLQKLWHVTIPMVSPSLLYVFVITTIQTFQEITGPLIIFSTASPGGPMNAGMFYTVYLYQTAFLDSRMGYASALAWVIFAILLVMTLTNFYFFGRHVYYANE